MSRIDLVGGPLCGMVLHPSRMAVFLFIDGGRCWRTPGKDRHLYAKGSADGSKSKGNGRVYVYAGHKRVYCAECGGFNTREKAPLATCALCGEKLISG